MQKNESGDCMGGYGPITHIEIQKVSYIHDPQAQKKWLQIFTEVFKEELAQEWNTPLLDDQSEVNPS